MHGALALCVSGAIINDSASSLLNGGSDGVFHAPQNLEKGGQGISPSTMHHLKSFFFPFGKRSVSHTL